MSDQSFLGLERMESEFLKVCLQTLGLPISGTSISSPPTCELYLSELNKDFIGTEYFCRDQRFLLHFTTLRNLFSIINEGGIRLYNLNHSTDQEEYRYVANNLYPIYKFFDKSFENKTKYDEYIYGQKEKLFVLSSTEPEEKNNPNFWKEYGDDSKGVAIEFEIINNPVEWSSFYFAKVKYGADYSALKEFINRWDSMHVSNPLTKYLIDLKQLIAFHKDSFYAKENEIRILTMPFKHSKHVDLYRSCTFTDAHRCGSGQIVKYFKMPLCDCTGNYINNQWSSQEFHNDFLDHAPRLRISNVYFGPNFPNFQRTACKLKIYMFNKLNCRMPDFYENQIRL